MTGARLAAIVHIGGSLLAVALFHLAGRSEVYVDGFLLIYGIEPLALLGCVLGVSRLWSPLPARLEVITAALWALCINVFALSQRIAEIARAAGDPTLVQVETAVLWATGVAMLASGLRRFRIRPTESRVSQIAEAGAFGVLGLYLVRAGAVVWGSTLYSRSGGFPAIEFETQLRLYVCIVATVAFGVAAVTTWGSRKAGA